MSTLALNLLVPADSITEQVRQGLLHVEERLCEIPEGQNPLLKAATQRLVAAGGKRLRPLICLHSASSLHADPERSISLAAGVEMLHTATLVHDDLIDRAMTRRGAPTLNSEHSPTTTVLIGDYLFARAAGLVASTGIVRITELFAETLMVILNGEINQRSSRWLIDLKEYYERIYAKTAALFVLATEAAAELGGADQATKSALVEFGLSVGMAFQIVDDVLDYNGDEHHTGKPVGADLRQGLFTLPSILYASEHPADPHIKLLTSGADRGADTIQIIIEKVRTSGIIEKALQEARRYTQQAQVALDQLPASPHINALSAIAESITDRNS